MPCVLSVQEEEIRKKEPRTRVRGLKTVICSGFVARGFRGR